MSDRGSTVELAATSVRKTYGDRAGSSTVVAIEDLTLEVLAGEFCAIVGPSGCGKTTFLNIVAGLDSATSGTLTLRGELIRGPGRERGVVFQDYALFPWKTVRDNVEFGPRARGLPPKDRAAIARRWIDAVGLAGFESKYPHELSGGMRQRCALARAMANDPEMLLMDEPLAAVDAQTRRILQDELLMTWGEQKAMAERKTILYVTHSIEEAVYLADKIVVMSARPGRIREIIQNTLPRPRKEARSSVEYVDRCTGLWGLLETDAQHSIRFMT